ncbi:MAG: IgGFc-binding protein [Pseudomonadota bacterium]
MKPELRNIVIVPLALLAAVCVAAAGCGSDDSNPNQDYSTDGLDWIGDSDMISDTPFEDPDQVCTPGLPYCLGVGAYHICNEDGSGYIPGGDCPPGTKCHEGVCLNPCDLADNKRSSIGCVYYAVDTNPMNAGDYAVAVSNTNEADSANVLIETREVSGWVPVTGGSFNVAPLTLHSMVLPHRYHDGSFLYQGGAYRITSDLPIIAYQFNPLDGSTSFLSDASLLLPKSGLDTYHIAMAWPQGPADDRTPEGYPAHIQIVSATDNNYVDVTPSIATIAGTGVEALMPGGMRTFQLQEGDFLQLTVANHMDSFTGTYIESTGPVALFSSNDCVNVPADINYCCCEHLEEQIFGLQTWGKDYVASRVPMRGAEPAMWQILASMDGTTVSFDYDPTITGLPIAVTLNRGESQIFQVGGPASAPGDFLITADQPILVAQFMVAAFMVESGGNNGDPSMVQAVPTDQYLDRYVVLVPQTWENDFFVITRGRGYDVTIDTVPVSATWFAVGASGYEVARVPVADGVHVVEGASPFGIIVVGYDSFDSYAYPGGLNLELINPII